MERALESRKVSNRTLNSENVDEIVVGQSTQNPQTSIDFNKLQQAADRARIENQSVSVLGLGIPKM